MGLVYRSGGPRGASSGPGCQVCVRSPVGFKEEPGALERKPRSRGRQTGPIQALSQSVQGPYLQPCVIDKASDKGGGPLSIQ